jgi:hypothetical protein
MFDLTFIIVLFSMLIVLSVIFFFISRVLFRIITITTSLLLIIMLIVGVLVVQDAQRLNTELARGPTTYILEDNGTALAGFTVLVLAEDAEGFDTAMLMEAERSPLPMNSTNAFRISIEAFYNHTLTVNDDFPAYMTMDAVLRIIEADDSFREYVEMTLDNDPYYQTVERSLAMQILMDEIMQIYDSDEVMLRSDMFMLLLSRTLKEEGSSFIFLEAKRGHVELYPPRLTMRLINIVPERLILQSARRIQ